MPLHIECEEHYLATLKFATDHGAEDKLQLAMKRLQNMANEGTCYLHSDFAPHSFAFMIVGKDGRRELVGGLIYSGPGQTLNGSSPTYTVSVDPPSNEHKWSVHT